MSEEIVRLCTTDPETAIQKITQLEKQLEIAREALDEMSCTCNARGASCIHWTDCNFRIAEETKHKMEAVK